MNNEACKTHEHQEEESLDKSMHHTSSNRKQYSIDQILQSAHKQRLEGRSWQYEHSQMAQHLKAADNSKWDA